MLVGGSNHLSPFCYRWFPSPLTALSTQRIQLVLLSHLTKTVMALWYGRRFRMLALKVLNMLKNVVQLFWLKWLVMEIPVMLYHMTSPHPEGQGAIKAIKLASKKQKFLQSKSFTSTPTEPQPQLMKRRKWCGIAAVLGKEVPVSSTKSLSRTLTGSCRGSRSHRTTEAMRHNHEPMIAEQVSYQTISKRMSFMD